MCDDDTSQGSTLVTEVDQLIKMHLILLTIKCSFTVIEKFSKTPRQEASVW